MLRIIKKTIKVTLNLVDTFLFIGCLPFFSIIMLILGKIRDNRTLGNERNLLLLGTGSSISRVLEKFGSFKPLFEHNPNQYFSKVIIAFYPAPKTRRLAIKNNIDVFDYKPNNAFLLLSSTDYLLRLLLIVKREKITLLRATSPYIIGSLGLILAKLTNLLFCISIHADYEKSEQLQGNVIPRIFGTKKIPQMIEKFVYKKADRILPIRESMIPDLIRKGCKKDKIRIFPHGIDLSLFKNENSNTGILKRLYLNGASKILSMAGRFEKENYIYDYIKIAEKLMNLRKDWILILVGDGKEYQNVRNEIKNRKLDNFVLTPGFLSNKEAIDIRKNSYINLCLMGGFSLIESCASGRPVIAYDVEWHYELVRDGETGFLIKEGVVNKVAERINYLLDNPDIAKRMGEKAKQLAFGRHSLEKTSKIKIRWYKELIEKYGRN